MAALPALGAIVTISGATLGAIGQLRAGADAAAAAEANAAIAQQQARIFREQAAEERQRSAIEAEIFAREARRRQGRRISAITASGVTLAGSALDVLVDAALEDAQSRALILHEGEQRALARLRGASIEEFQSAEFQRQAAAERGAAPIRAAATILGAAGTTAFELSRSPSARRAV